MDAEIVTTAKLSSVDNFETRHPPAVAGTDTFVLLSLAINSPLRSVNL